MSPERSKINPSENRWVRFQALKGGLEKAQSTGQLLRTAKFILRSWPRFKEEAGAAKFLHDPLIVIGDYMIRSSVDVHKTDSGDVKIETLRIDKYVDKKTSQGESWTIEYRGIESEAQWDGSQFVENYKGLSYTENTEMGGKPERDPETNQTVFKGEASEPIRDKEALPKVREILGEILDGVIDEFEREEKSPLEVYIGVPFSLDHNHTTKRDFTPRWMNMDFKVLGPYVNGVVAVDSESGIHDITLTLKDLILKNFAKYKVFLIYDGKRYKPGDIDIDDLQLRQEANAPLHFSEWQNENGEYLELDSDIDIFSKVQFVVEEVKVDEKESPTEQTINEIWDQVVRLTAGRSTFDHKKGGYFKGPGGETVGLSLDENPRKLFPAIIINISPSKEEEGFTYTLYKEKSLSEDQIEKRIEREGPSSVPKGLAIDIALSHDWAEIERNTNRIMEIIAGQLEDRNIRRLRGLSFVGEKEARALLQILLSVEPIDTDSR